MHFPLRCAERAGRHAETGTAAQPLGQDGGGASVGKAGALSTPAWSRAPGTSETCQSCVSARLIFRSPWHQRPRGGLRGGPQEKQGWAAWRLPHQGTLWGGTGALLSPATLGSERVTAPSQLGVRSHGQPRRQELATQGPAGTLFCGLRGGESPGSLGNSPAHGQVCAPHTSPMTTPPETGLEDPLWADALRGWASLQGLPVIELVVGGWGLGGDSTTAVGGASLRVPSAGLEASCPKAASPLAALLRVWSQGPRRPGQPKNEPLALVTNG